MVNQCRCGHHVFTKILTVLGVLAAIAFLYTAWSNNYLWGMEMDSYFEHVVVFSLLMLGTRSCKCCCDVGCGKNCGTGMCMPGKDMGMNKDKGMM